MFKYILFIDGNDSGILYANDDAMAYSKAEYIIAELGYYVPDTPIEVERIA